MRTVKKTQPTEEAEKRWKRSKEFKDAVKNVLVDDTKLRPPIFRKKIENERNIMNLKG